VRSYPDSIFQEKAYRSGIEDAFRDYEAQVSETRFQNWTSTGPVNIGGRITSLAINPINQQIIFAGTPNGGIFRSVNSGATWTPIFDQNPYLAIGDIEIDPNNTQTIYAGTGDKVISGYPFIGNGLFKSTNGGNTWINIGLEDKGIISQIRVHPSNSNLIFAASMGTPFKRDLNRGLYKSLDGGNNWDEILQLGDQTGIIDLAVHPTNPAIIYAAGWDRIRNNTESTVTGLGGKIYKTTDAGNSWTTMSNGLPQDTVSRIGLAMDPVSSSILYAVYVSKDLELQAIYKTINGGDLWQPIPIENLLEQNPEPLGGFGWYFGNLRINPYNSSELYLLGVQLWRTVNDGSEWQMVDPDWSNFAVHADKHDMVFFNENSFVLATDGGIYKTTDAGENWIDLDFIPNTQFYRVAVNPEISGDYWGGTQDNGTIRLSDPVSGFWDRQRGGDGFSVYFHPTLPGVVYSTIQYGNIGYAEDYFDGYYSDMTLGIDATDRVAWDAPHFISTHFPHESYMGTYRVYKKNDPTITDSSDLWYPVSEDITDGLIYEERFHTITALCESPLVKGLLYAGTTDGNLWRSDNDGNSWVNISSWLPERYVTDIKASAQDADRVFVSHSGYKDDDHIPHLHRSENRGLSWTDISGNLPALAVNHLEIYPDTADALLFAATDGGVYYSINSGNSWSRLGNNMPVYAVYDLAIDEVNDILIAGTFARSMMKISLQDVLAEMNNTGIAGSVNEPSSVIRYDAGNEQLIIDASESGVQLLISDIQGRIYLQKILSMGINLLSGHDWPRGLSVVQLIEKNAPQGLKICRP